MSWKDRIRPLIPESFLERRRNILLASDARKGSRSVSMSQYGQDLWVYGEAFNEQCGRYFVDAGAYNGVHISNTLILEARYGWQGICIEGNPVNWERMRRVRQCQCLNLCVDREPGVIPFAIHGVIGGIVAEDCDQHFSPTAEVIEVKSDTLYNILQREQAPKVIDYLSMDIEGAEDRALMEFPFDEYRFNCITIERPSAALRARLEAHDYLLIKEVPTVDCYYIHRSFRSDYLSNANAWSAKHFYSKPW